MYFLRDKRFDLTQLRARLNAAWTGASLRQAVAGTRGREVFVTDESRIAGNGMLGSFAAQMLFPIFSIPYLRAISQGGPESTSPPPSLGGNII